ncbi:bel12-ag transposon polyprotein, partial [Lasius niger]
MEALVAAQRELHGRIARSYENLRKVGTAKMSVALVKSALVNLESKWLKFEEQHERLLLEFSEEVADDEYSTADFVSTVELAYLEQRAKLMELEQALTEATAGAEQRSIRVETTASRRVLPRIQLPQFSGKFEDWPSFRDLFLSIVVEETSLSKVEKMHYLKTCVKGDAEQLIRSLPSTEENFERAWATLSEHFENKRLLVRSYLAAFTALPKMKSDSAADLRRIFHGVVTTVGALEGIGRPIASGTDLFVHLVIELLDTKTRREWENSLGKSSEPPSYEDLREFLQEQLMTQEVLRAVSGESGKSAEKSGRAARSNHVKSRGPDSSRSCPLCKKEHFMAFCDQYKRKSAQERREAVATHQRCWNCLGRHMLGECSSNKVCTKCSERHHSSLHEAFAAVALPAPGSSASPTVHVAKRPLAECTSVLLATARVLVVDRRGMRHPVRVLVDPGSETSLIAESLAQRLRLPRTPTSVTIFGVGGVQAGFSRGRVAVNLSARTGSFSLTVSSLVMPRLSAYSGVAETGAVSWPHVEGLDLADPDFLARDPVELLLGADAYAHIVLPDLRRGGTLEPIAQHTRLGWILLGAVGAGHVASVSSMQCSTTEDLASLVRRFWEWEEPPSIALPLSAENQECEDFFSRTLKRLSDGRYQVRLPLRAELPDLAFTRRAASRLLEVMSRRFERDSEFGDRYRTFMADYLALGHMTPVSGAASNTGFRACYLQHHGVLRSSGVDAKIRVVFNGSARGAAGVSLNDSVLTGPNLLPALADVV